MEEPKYYIVTAITTKCPVCGQTVTDIGKNAEDLFSASNIQCLKCGFTGELPE